LARLFFRNTKRLSKTVRRANRSNFRDRRQIWNKILQQELGTVDRTENKTNNAPKPFKQDEAAKFVRRRGLFYIKANLSKADKPGRRNQR
jgi:hypothetical protein